MHSSTLELDKMINRDIHLLTLFVKFTAALACVFSLSHCSTQLPECDGPALNTSELKSIKKTFFSSGPKAYLVVPNPIDATQIPTIQSSDTSLLQELDSFSLPGLLNSQKLENSFLKIRIQSQTDDPSILAKPNAKGDYQFPLTDVHYGETMAYHSLQSIQKYVEALGFSVVKSRPLFVYVRAKSDDGDSTSVNALYSHNYLNPSQPRLMRLYGDGQYAPSMDRDMYWHEFGHLFNESVNFESGIDYAGDSGAIFTEGSAIHECLADYLAESAGDKGNIGKWIARNFQEFQAGSPLRSAEPKNDDFNDFSRVSINDGTGQNPERYRMAEWCTRVLWDIRKRILTEDPEYGAIFADRLIFSGASLLQRDATVKQFKEAITTADKKLHCGLHSRSITSAFESRGFQSEPAQLGAPLTLQASPVGVNYSGSTSSLGNPTPGNEVTFTLKLNNPNGEIARNVRVILESRHAHLIPTTYAQSYADLPPGASVTIGSGNLGVDYSVFATIDKNAKVRSRLPYRIRVKPENGPETVVDGEIGL